VRKKLFRPLATLLCALTLVSLTPLQALAEGDYIAEMETGRTAFRAGDFATAEIAFQGALTSAETDKRRAMAWFALGLTALRLGHKADAHLRAEQSLALVPDDARAKELLALSAEGAAPAQ
jgi:Flp pilus assembly protein TadD